MPQVKNQNGSEKLEPGTVLLVSGVDSENDAVLAVENYLRVNRQEQFELSLPEKCENGTYEITLSEG